MWSTWTKLCQANVNFHNKHTIATTVIPVVGIVGALVGIRIAARKMAEREVNYRINRPR